MTDNADASGEPQYRVLVNHEQQHSLWRVDIEIPKGWTAVFGPDTREACLAYVDREWTDMRPLSLRQQMDRAS